MLSNECRYSHVYWLSPTTSTVHDNTRTYLLPTIDVLKHLSNFSHQVILIPLFFNNLF